MIRRTVTLLIAMAFVAADVHAMDKEEEPDYARSGVYLELDGQAMVDLFRHNDTGEASGGIAERAGWRIASRVASDSRSSTLDASATG